MSHKEKKELEALPKRIEVLEAEQAALHETMADPSFYNKPAAEIAEANAKLAARDVILKQSYARWEELEGLQ